MANRGERLSSARSLRWRWEAQAPLELQSKSPSHSWRGHRIAPRARATWQAHVTAGNGRMLIIVNSSGAPDAKFVRLF
jgi:hypothetical protein